MKYITEATEKRLEKVVIDYSTETPLSVLKKIYDKYLSLNDMWGAKIKELKKWGGFIPENAFGLSDCGVKGDVDAEPIVRGLAVRYPELISYRGTHDLDYVSIKDFNKLVRILSE